MACEDEDLELASCVLPEVSIQSILSNFARLVFRHITAQCEINYGLAFFHILRRAVPTVKIAIDVLVHDSPVVPHVEIAHGIDEHPHTHLETECSPSSLV